MWELVNTGIKHRHIWGENNNLWYSIFDPKKEKIAYGCSRCGKGKYKKRK